MQPVIFLFVVAAVIVAIVLTKNAKKKADEAWSEAARSLGLRSVPRALTKGRKLKGELGGHRVEVDTYRKSAGNNSQTYTRYRVHFPSLGLGLKLGKQKVMHGLGKAFGLQDIEVGSRAFDDAFLVQGRSETRVRAFLTPDRQLRLRRALAAFYDIEVTDSSATGIRRGLERRPAVLETTVRQFVQLARALGGDPASEAPVPRALTARQEGDLEAALSSLEEHASEPRAEPDPDARVAAAEILFSLGEEVRSLEVLEEAAPGLHEEDEAHRLLDVLRQRAESAPPPAEAPEPARQPALATSSPVDTDPAAVAALLFSDNELGFRVAQRFEEELQGHGVHWTGELVRVSSFYSDLVFGSSPGTRAQVKLCDIEGREVSAIVGLSREAEEELKARIGETLSFEGRLVRCDAFLRNLFVAEARITG